MSWKSTGLDDFLHSFRTEKHLKKTTYFLDFFGLLMWIVLRSLKCVTRSALMVASGTSEAQDYKYTVRVQITQTKFYAVCSLF